jgi:PAS domain S-box-containing protein
MVEVYRVTSASGSLSSLEPVIDVAAPTLPAAHSRAAVDRLAAQALNGSAEAKAIETLGAAGDLLHAAAVIRTKDGKPSGVVVATAYLTGDLAARSRRMTKAFEDYNQLRVLKRPLTGLYLSFFLMVTLLILFGAIWMGSYLAKRITRPVLMLSAAAREIGAGRLDQRLEPQSNDEFGSLVEAFNAMARELAAGRRKVDRGTIQLERKHGEVEGRRRYIETILERIATGVVSVDASGAITTINSAASRLLSLDRQIVGQPAMAVFDRADLQPLGALLAGAGSRGRGEPQTHEIALAREGQELHLAAVATQLVGEGGRSDGVVLVLDDVTPLIRAQKVAAWREVARRLAHEIKNPLTPIQLSAERLAVKLGGKLDAADEEALLRGTQTIVTQVAAMKHMVDDFAIYARQARPGRMQPVDLKALLIDVLGLYENLRPHVSLKLVDDNPLIQGEPTRLRQVFHNLLQNAVDAQADSATPAYDIAIEVRGSELALTIGDRGIGFPEDMIRRAFEPYVTTKAKGTGLGLAIVKKIVEEHHGRVTIENRPQNGALVTLYFPLEGITN